MSSYPNLQVVFTSSLIGSLLATKLSSDSIQLFAFSAATGVISNWKGYENEGFPIPKNGLLIAWILAGWLGTHPLFGRVKTSIVLGSLLYPTWIVLKDLEDFSQVIKDKGALALSILNPFDG